MTEHEQLLALCTRLGAAGAQAETMARQLTKRADQLSHERGIAREEAMTYLLQLVVKGRNGEPPPGFEGLPPHALPMREKLIQEFTQVFGRAPEIVTRAPGRIEFIGNHTDYNGGTVLGAAIDRGVWVGIAAREDGQRRFYSAISGEITSVSADSLVRQMGKASWANYPLGVLAALPHFSLNAPRGFDFLAASDLPTGAGLSSSAALELSSALAFMELGGQSASREVLVAVGKHAENNFVGVPCGILDQGVSGFGQRDRLVFIDCRGPKFETVPLPADAHFWIFNTDAEHALVDGLYAERHRECMEAVRLLGVSALVEADRAKVDASAAKLPANVLKRARHVVDEIARVGETCAALGRSDLTAVGKLLTASHRSSQTLFENSVPELDFLVDTLTVLPNVYGARLTGGGFGGAVMALTSGRFSEAQAKEVAAAYQRKFGGESKVLHCKTGDGAQVVASAARLRG